jgi:predicted ATPase
MIKDLELIGVGPAKVMKLNFGNRLNLFTGDNGLGKSFLFDTIWWAMTRKWPAEINDNLVGSGRAIPSGKDASIKFSFSAKVKSTETYTSQYDPRQQAWTGHAGRPANPGLVLYAMSDGSFAVWDPARNYWTEEGKKDIKKRIPAYVLTANQVWNGLMGSSNNWLCNGLIRDWASWQDKNGRIFQTFKKVLHTLSPDSQHLLKPGELKRLSLDDTREFPTLVMPYGETVPVVNVSSGMKRILALAYLLVWAWEEHQQAAHLIGEPPTHQITFLIDEIESHLHPTWQRRVVPAILSVLKNLTGETQTQLLAATHSPLIMTSLEPLFDPAQDHWFDIDFEDSEVVLRQREFEKLGTVGSWLQSEAFDQHSDRASEYERLI